MAIPVNELKLPRSLKARLCETFDGRRYATAEEIVSRGVMELFKQKNIGRGKIRMIRDALAEQGLHLEIPRDFELPTERARRLRRIRRFNAQLRARAKERGLFI